MRDDIMTRVNGYHMIDGMITGRRYNVNNKKVIPMDM
jgi:hypothetical protein